MVEVDCNDDNPDDTVDGTPEEFFSILELTGLTADDILIIRVARWNSSASNALDGEFEISVSADDPTLSVVSPETESAFSYYPNPVKNKLTLNAVNNIQNVSIVNILGQEVMRVKPNSISSDIDTSALQTGAYFDKVTINNVDKTIRILKQ